jgi:hypothetical protein
MLNADILWYALSCYGIWGGRASCCSVRPMCRGLTRPLPNRFSFPLTPRHGPDPAPCKLAAYLRTHASKVTSRHREPTWMRPDMAVCPAWSVCGLFCTENSPPAFTPPPTHTEASSTPLPSQPHGALVNQCRASRGNAQASTAVAAGVLLSKVVHCCDGGAGPGGRGGWGHCD